MATNLPACGQTCLSNMFAIQNSEFGCSSGDAVCYCSNTTFGYGIRDCANQACTAEDAITVITFIANYCAAAGVSASGSQVGSTLSSAQTRTSSVLAQTLTTPISTPTSSSDSTASRKFSTSEAFSPPSSTSPSDNSGGSSGLSSTAKIGLAAGIPCGVIFILAMGFAAYFFGKSRAAAKAQAPPAYVPGTEHSRGPVYERAEIDGTEVRRQELETLANRPELPEKTGRDAV